MYGFNKKRKNIEFFFEIMVKKIVEHKRIFLETGVQLSVYFFKGGYIEVVCEA